MRNFILVIALQMIMTVPQAQTYYIYDDSVLLIMKVVTSKRGTIEKFHFKIENKSSQNLFICTQLNRNPPLYINNLDGPLVIGCGCEYGYNQDYTGSQEYEVININKNDSLVFDMSTEFLANKKRKKITFKEFSKRSLLFKLDYVLSNDLLLFLNKRKIHENFIKSKRRLAFSTP